MLRAGLVIAGTIGFMVGYLSQEQIPAIGALALIFTIGFMVGYLSQEQIPAIGALALIFIGAGASMKRREESK